jgi:hypothetical protein
MATTLIKQWIAPSVIQAQWAALAGGETGDVWECPMFGDKTATLSGTFGTSTVTLQGSNDGTNWFTVNDFLDVAAFNAATAAAMKTLGNNPRYLRPVVAAGTGTGLNMTIVARGGAR